MQKKTKKVGKWRMESKDKGWKWNVLRVGLEPHLVNQLIGLCPFNFRSSSPSLLLLIIFLFYFFFPSAHYSASVCPLSHCFPHKRIPWIHWALSVHWLHVSRSGIPLKFTRTRSFTRQQPISRHPDQTIRWAHHASIPPWVIVGVLPTWPAMTCSVSEGQSF